MEPTLIAEKAWSPDLYWKLYVGHPTPPRELCVTAFCFAFRDGKIALTRHHRGWDVPGGHSEPGESMDDCARRETFEETGLRVGELSLIAVHRVDQKKPHERDGRPYPFPTTFGLWYCADVVGQEPIPAGSESSEVGFYDPDGIRAFGFSFLPAFERALETARERNLIV